MKTAAELRAELAAAEKAERAAREAKLKAIPREYEYRTKWKSDYTARVSRRLTPECADAIRAEGGSFTWDEDQWRGMDYVLIAGHIIPVSGGTIVLRLHAETFSHEPFPITPEEEREFRAGGVPVRLRG